MQIISYTTSDPDAPEHMRCAAALDQSGPGMHWITFGATPQEAQAKLQAFLAPKPRKPKAVEDASEDPGDVI